jgi:hypothetical protein
MRASRFGCLFAQLKGLGGHVVAIIPKDIAHDEQDKISQILRVILKLLGQRRGDDLIGT